jgi:hypothetical protein
MKMNGCGTWKLGVRIARCRVFLFEKIIPEIFAEYDPARPY